MRVKIEGRPRYSLQEAEQLASDLYGLSAKAWALPSERDQNFLLVANDRAYVLKIANAAEAWDVLAFQNGALNRVQERDKELGCPRVIPTKRGDSIHAEAHNDGNVFFVRLISYLDGTRMAEIREHPLTLLRSLGRFLGRLDQALAGYEHAAAHRPLQWSLRQAPEVIRRFGPHIADPYRRAIVEHFLLQYETNVQPQLSSLPSGIIHNDANDHNILVGRDESGEPSVAGLIDFGDMVYGPYAHEPAVAAAYAMLDQPDPLLAAAQVIAGYHQVFPLSEREVGLLFDLIAIRLSTSVCLSAYQQEILPEDDYLVVSQRAAWELLEKLIGLDPGLAEMRFREACGLPRSEDGRLEMEEIIRLRSLHLGPSLSLSYRSPLNLVRGFRQYLFDNQGRPYLDAVNNVPHVGHCHPRVVRAGQRQMALLNTNTRYLHELLVRYASELCATLPEPLRVCYFVCTGSEANELALRMAKAHTGGSDFVVVDGAYHGNTAALVDISPYKFDGPGGQGLPRHVRKVAMPDLYRGPYNASDPDAATKYAAKVHDAVVDIAGDGRTLAAFICESVLGCGGQIVLPTGYLEAAYAHVRAAGGVCIADEVQVGFGRVGSHFWGFETQAVVPDIVTMGKPMGNGHPLAAVVTSPEIAASFDTGMEYFNTYGGNPVSCAIGLAVLDVIAEEGLQANAQRVGARLLAGLKGLMLHQPLIGDVRGLGLFAGVELVRDRKTLAPAAEEASEVVEAMKDRGVLVSTDGPLHNVLKIKPPLVFSEDNADFLVYALGDALATLRGAEARP